MLVYPFIKQQFTLTIKFKRYEKDSISYKFSFRNDNIK